jgi:hypothetical protein
MNFGMVPTRYTFLQEPLVLWWSHTDGWYKHVITTPVESFTHSVRRKRGRTLSVFLLYYLLLKLLGNLQAESTYRHSSSPRYSGWFLSWENAYLVHITFADEHHMGGHCGSGSQCCTWLCVCRAFWSRWPIWPIRLLVWLWSCQGKKWLH